MNFDKRSLDRLLSLDDAELSQIIREIAAEAGVDASGISLGEAELKKLPSVTGSREADRFYISAGVCHAVIFPVVIILAVLHLHSMTRIELEDSISVQ